MSISARKLVRPPTGNWRDRLVYGSYKPDATNTGPVPGTVFTQYGDSSSSTDFVASYNGQVIENLEIWGRVSLLSYTNVTIRNCIIHGRLDRIQDTAYIITNSSDYRGARIIDTAIIGRSNVVPASYNSVPNPDAGNTNLGNEHYAGIKGGNFTILRCEIRNVRTGLSFTAVGNVVAKGCWIHDGWFNEWDQTQADSGYYPPGAVSNYTHNDGAAIFRCSNYLIFGNRIGGVRVPGNHHQVPSQKDDINSGDDMFSAGMIIKQQYDSTPANKIENAVIEANWFAGGRSTVNLSFNPATSDQLDGVSIRNNRFTRSTWGAQDYIMRDKINGVGIGDVSGNVFEDDGSPVPIVSGTQHTI